MRIPTIAAVTLLMASAGTGIASAAPPQCSDLDGTVTGATCQVLASDPAYTVDIGFPSDYPDQKAIFDYVKQTRDGFLNVAKTPDSRPLPYALQTKATEYGSAVPPRGTQSVVLETYESMGGAHPTTFYKAFNWDQGYRKPITIDNLFRQGTQPFPVIYPMVADQVAKQFGGDAESIPAAVGLDPSTYQNFAITNDSLIFFFDRGAVLSEAAGAFEVTVPRGPIDSMIA